MIILEEQHIKNNISIYTGRLFSWQLLEENTFIGKKSRYQKYYVTLGQQFEWSFILLIYLFTSEYFYRIAIQKLNYIHKFLFFHGSCVIFDIEQDK